jgi:hypothetical protein
MHQIGHNFGWEQIPVMTSAYWKVLAIMGLGYLLHWLPDALKNKGIGWFIATPFYQKVLISVLVVFIIYQSVSAGLQPFIYFRF